jgi:hypothetical protein
MDSTKPLITTPTTNYFQKAIEQFNAEGIKKPKNYPPILVVGDSGTGKTASMRNLPPLETAILNIENKPLSFLGGEKFPYQFGEFKLPSDIDICLLNCFKEPAIKYVVIDSITKYFEMLFAFAVDQTKNDKNSYAKFNFFNAWIGGFLEAIKPCGQKFVIVTGIPETLTETLVDGSMTRYRRLSVKGKEWEAKVEKEFVLCLYTDVKRTVVGQPPAYKFITNDGVTSSAKSPQGIFKDLIIDNDLMFVCNRVKEFYKLV